MRVLVFAILLLILPEALVATFGNGATQFGCQPMPPTGQASSLFERWCLLLEPSPSSTWPSCMENDPGSCQQASRTEPASSLQSSLALSPVAPESKAMEHLRTSAPYTSGRDEISSVNGAPAASRAEGGSSAESTSQSDAQQFEDWWRAPEIMIPAMITYIAALLASMTMIARGMEHSRGGKSEAAAPIADFTADTDAEACRKLLGIAATELMSAYKKVGNLTHGAPLQSALNRELDVVRERLGLAPAWSSHSKKPLSWQQLRAQLMRTIGEIRRISGIADAATASLTAHPAAAEIVSTKLEAFTFLGVHPQANTSALKKTIDGLRQCWHPDLAEDDDDRRHREVRIRQINAAWDLIQGREMTARVR
jgi:hypothetical protein